MMPFHSIIRSLLQTPVATEGRGLELKPGQIFYGKLGKLFSGQYAEIWLDGQKLMAKMEAPLISGKGYWFQVSYKSGEMILKVLNKEQGPFARSIQPNSSPHLLGLRDTKTHQAFTKFLMDEQLSFTKEEIHQAAHLLSLADHSDTGMQILKVMNRKNIPLHESLFKSLLEVHKETTISNSMGHLRQLLIDEKHVSETGKAILKLLEEWEMPVQHSKNDLSNESARQVALTKMKQSMMRLGLDYEARLFHNQFKKETIETSFKPLLVKYVQEETVGNSKARDVAESLLLRMNGQQLLSLGSNHIQTLLYEIPIQLGTVLSDLTIQWTGRKSEDGKLDTDYCHIIFYLDLEYLKKTIVDMQVQNRIVSILIINDFIEVKQLAETFIPALRSGLEEIDYRLSGVHFKSSDQENKQTQTRPLSQQGDFGAGVDIRV
ncbi:hypothetical protein MUB24_01605 [Lederbergia sp. NSJ-179]|uniref:hypothetical protein n=1 Tax=Lederbergia sp. NSJ-179 TaxID=2931402 RepID=UPI001FD0AA91|nr:hypothetical protein [Lederbergia sp. NSJ-179]MCJ7839624.1 hypothetical protein [Lederbergia sp. NSJ-179]